MTSSNTTPVRGCAVDATADAVWSFFVRSRGASWTTNSVWYSFPSRISSRRCLLPIGACPTRLRSWPLSMTSRPSNRTTTSPRLRPARSADPFICRSVTIAPFTSGRRKIFPSDGLTSCVDAPRNPLTTRPVLIKLCIAARAMLLGMAKPTPTLPPVGLAMAVLIPTSSPLILTSAPPEFPGLMGASVWIKSSKSATPTSARPTALTIPKVTVRLNPKGFPIARTKSPTARLLESPQGAVGRFVA